MLLIETLDPHVLLEDPQPRASVLNAEVQQLVRQSRTMPSLPHIQGFS